MKREEAQRRVDFGIIENRIRESERESARQRDLTAHGFKDSNSGDTEYVLDQIEELTYRIEMLEEHCESLESMIHDLEEDGIPSKKKTEVGPFNEKVKERIAHDYDELFIKKGGNQVEERRNAEGESLYEEARRRRGL